MPDEAIDSVRIQKPLDRKLKYKNDRGENGKSPKIHAMDIELANHGMLLHVTRAAALGPDCARRGRCYLHRLMLRRIRVERPPQADNRSHTSVGRCGAGCYFVERNIDLL
ncbi:MAG: hypothetical protein ACLQJ0_09830 [Steroidobacteraceae bacterium]|jgi:hypothetical protein